MRGSIIGMDSILPNAFLNGIEGSSDYETSPPSHPSLSEVVRSFEPKL